MLKYCHFSLIVLAFFGTARATGVGFPDLTAGRFHKETSVSADQVARVIVGMKHRQVYQLLGLPHFARGIKSDRWASLFTLVDKAGARVEKCQMNISFEGRRVAAISWSRVECEAALK